MSKAFPKIRDNQLFFEVKPQRIQYLLNNLLKYKVILLAFVVRNQRILTRTKCLFSKVLGIDDVIPQTTLSVCWLYGMM